jgi:chemotaxis receptor (MCP) glutamine deamidase CheD
MKEKFITPDRNQGLTLEVRRGEYPIGRKILNKEGVEEDAKDRTLLKPTEMNGVTDVPFLQYGIGNFEDMGLRYIKTEPLGSCVALTLYSPDDKLGGIGHFTVTNNAVDGARKILQELEQRGVKLDGLQARLFGGSVSEQKRRGEDIVDNPDSQKLIIDLLTVLQRKNIAIVEHDLYGDQVRCVMLSLEDGEVFDYPYDNMSVKKMIV